jgi:beta-glucosidase
VGVTRPGFYLGVGIENCWMAEHDEPHRPPHRLLDVFLQMQHYSLWKEDLQLAADLGINAIRYSVPWYRANPRPGEYDWGWIEGPLRALETKRIIPVIDLVHYGTPLWMENCVLNHDFPQRVADYAAAWARRFAGLVDHFTPFNEPQLSAWFCGCIAYWPPYLAGLDGLVKVGVNIARGLVLASQALRAECRNATLISADTLVSATVETAARSLRTPFDLLSAAEKDSFDFLVRTFPACLAYGTVTEGCAFDRHLRDFGVPGDLLDWFRRSAQLPDIVGHNYYPMFLDEQPGGTLASCIDGGVDVLKRRLRRTAAAYGKPVYISETSAGTTPEEKIRWMENLCGVVEDLGREGITIAGINWWPLYETIQWDYRDNARTVMECIRSGGWNNGLFRIEERADGTLARIPTGAEAGFRRVMGRLLKR